MKREATFQLIKDIILAVVAWLGFGIAFSMFTTLGNP